LQKNTLLLISGVSYVVVLLASCFLLLAFIFWLFASCCFSLALASQAATRSVSRHLHSEALLVFRTNGPLSGVVAIFWGGSGLACVCVAFEQRRVEFFQPHWKPDWFATASGFRRSLSTNLFLCVWREGRRMDGWRSLIFSTGLYRACYIE
jgi:hypothetical protein